MRLIIGNKSQYYIQTNNAQVELFKDYFHQVKNIACGPETAAAGYDISGRNMKIFTPGEQPGDSILMIMHNPKNLKKFEYRRKLNYDEWPPNEVPQAYDVVGRILYGEDASLFHWGFNSGVVIKNINGGVPMMVGTNLTKDGHYVLIVGFDLDKGTLIYNDPYPYLYEDKQGYNREIKYPNPKIKISNWRVDFYPPKE
jgi:hypothetical protein